MFDKFLEFMESFIKWCQRDKKSEYIPPFSGHWVNTGTRYDEHWEWNEPKYKTRYLNVLQKREAAVIKLSWKAYPDALYVEECEDQREAVIKLNCFPFYFDDEIDVIVDHDDEFFYINVYYDINNIVVNLSKTKRSEEVIESIMCFGMDEANEILTRIVMHYEDYTVVSVHREC
jgi:hypothetical protein